MSDVLEEPPEEEGDNSEAGGGKPVAPTKEGEISETPELEEDDEGEKEDGPDS